MSGTQRVVVDVPVRACDVGGWTDTWFAGSSRVCSLAVGPAVSVAVTATDGDGEVIVVAPDLDARFAVTDAPPEHRLLAAAVAEAGGASAGRRLEIDITSAVPPATSLGTSAAVCVGVIAALDAVRTGAIRPPGDLAAAAHRVESVRIGRQSGVQDQQAAAHGGANLIDVDYPSATVTPIDLAPDVRAKLDDRLLHVAYGGGHDSSAVHEQVIAELEVEGAAATRLERLRLLAGEAHRALAAGDLEAYGRTLTAATEAQADLHHALVSADARAVIDLARNLGSLGWKVNGAAGSSGSLSVLCRSGAARRRLAQQVRDAGHLPLALLLSDAGARTR
jgi:D-glycero-alpha-D-manno-heptose-7-phosphate kinase